MPSVSSGLCTLATVALLALAPARAQDLAANAPAASGTRTSILDPTSAPAYYVVESGATLRSGPSATAPLLATLQLRDGVRVLDADSSASEWRFVQTADRRGYVRAAALSNVWLRVDKSDRTVYVYRGADLVRTLPADMSMAEGDKTRRAGLDEQDLWRTPEGTFFVTRRNAGSQYYRAFVISYPSPIHALRGLDAGIITQADYEAIVRAHQEGREPPQGTRLGGLIELHGSGSGRRTAWTRGCIALRNVHMDDLWEIVAVGTPIVIEP